MTHTTPAAGCGFLVWNTAMPVQSKVERSDARLAQAPPILLPVIVLLLSIGACATIAPAEPVVSVARCNADAARWVIEREPGSAVVARANVRDARLDLQVKAHNVFDGLTCG